MEDTYSIYTMGRKMPNTKIWFCLAFFRASLLDRKSPSFRSSWLKIWVILMPDRFSDRKVFRSVVRSFTTRWTFRVNLRKMTVNSTRKGTKHRIISVSA